MGILWFVGAVLCYRLIKWAICVYKESMSRADDYREERITELIGPPVTNKSEIQDKTEMEAKKPDTTQLIIETLKGIGCQPDIGKDGAISVAYQGENFIMQPNGKYVRIWDPSWSSIRVDDPNLPMLKEAVNEANYSFGPTILLGTPDDEMVCLHSRLDIILLPELPNIGAYVGAMLDSFFQAKENVRDKFQELNAKQEAAQKKRRPVGFDLSELNLSEQ